MEREAAQKGFMGARVPASRRAGSRVRTRQHAAKRGNDGRLRAPDGRNGLIVLPPAPQAFVKLHELLALSHLRLRVLLLQIVELTLGIDDIEEIGEAAIVADLDDAQRPSPGALWNRRVA